MIHTKFWEFFMFYSFVSLDWSDQNSQGNSTSCHIFAPYKYPCRYESWTHYSAFSIHNHPWKIITLLINWFSIFLHIYMHSFVAIKKVVQGRIPICCHYSIFAAWVCIFFFFFGHSCPFVCGEARVSWWGYFEEVCSWQHSCSVFCRGVCLTGGQSLFFIDMHSVVAMDS